jgi:hypothetical protein
MPAQRRIEEVMTLTFSANGLHIVTAVIPESQTTDLQNETLRRILPNCTVTWVPRYL